MPTVNEAQLHEMVEGIFLRAGLNEVQSGAVARTIVAGERDGCKAHGIFRVDGALRTMKAGKVDPSARPDIVHVAAPGLLRVDARGGFINASLELTLPLLAERAKALGVAALAVNNGASFSALWPEVEVLAAEGLASLAMCPSYATVAPAGGTAPLLGTNPLAFGWPRPGGLPHVFDIATSVAARGEIELHRRAGEFLPDGWAVDAEGHPTTDPTAALEGAMLTFGGHKGSAISTMIELLAGAMIDDVTSAEALATLGTTSLIPTHGELVIALYPEAFSRDGRGSFVRRAEALFDAVLGQGARLPSQRRFAARAASAQQGIELSDAELAHLDDLLERGLDAVD